MKTVTKKIQKTATAGKKDIVSPKTAVEVVGEPVKKKEKYFAGIGRRKTSTARARLYPQKKSDDQPIEASVNGIEYKKYFAAEKLFSAAVSPVHLLNLTNRFRISVLVNGGGKSAQAEAMRLGIARALITANPIFKKPLKRAGYLSRDARKKERKKPGLKKARRAPQWQKR
jgi:small subunit ribosomal protein S9